MAPEEPSLCPFPRTQKLPGQPRIILCWMAEQREILCKESITVPYLEGCSRWDGDAEAAGELCRGAVKVSYAGELCR